MPNSYEEVFKNLLAAPYAIEGSYLIKDIMLSLMIQTIFAMSKMPNQVLPLKVRYTPKINSTLFEKGTHYAQHMCALEHLFKFDKESVV